MRLVEFIKWWWENNDSFNRTVLVFVAGAIFPSVIVSAIFAVEIGLLVLLGSLIAIVAFWILLGLFKGLKEEWENFNRARPPEDVRIVRRLKGEDESF